MQFHVLQFGPSLSRLAFQRPPTEREYCLQLPFAENSLLWQQLYEVITYAVVSACFASFKQNTFIICFYTNTDALLSWEQIESTLHNTFDAAKCVCVCARRFVSPVTLERHISYIRRFPYFSSNTVIMALQFSQCLCAHFAVVLRG